MQGTMKRAMLAGVTLLAVLVAFAIFRRGDAAIESSPRAAPGPHPCNVLLLVVDTLRANRLSCYGYPRPTSPNIDRLARRGTLYRNNHSQSSWTLTSMISMMTSKSMIAEAKSLPSSVSCLAGALHDQGLETAAFIANPVVGRSAAFERGFDVFEVFGLLEEAEAGDVDGIELAERFSIWYRERAQRAAAGAERRRFFAWIQFIDPHHPYAPDPRHDVFHGPRPDEAQLRTRWREALPRVQELAPGFSTPSFEQCVEKMLGDSNRYDGEVKAVDDGVGRILAELEQAGELGDTLVILCADHGEMLYEHSVQPLIVRRNLDYYGGLPDGVASLFGCGHRPWFYEDLWNTPLILAGPGMPAGVERAGMPANLDIFPTCLDALDLPGRTDLEGVSLWGGIEPAREEVYAYGYGTTVIFERSRKKLIVSPRTYYELEKNQPEPLQLYDLARDPLEEKNLAQAEPAEAARMRRKVGDWVTRSTRGWSSAYTPEQLKIMKRLGYTGEDE
jgi:arylsulfatase A-like enzyme